MNGTDGNGNDEVGTCKRKSLLIVLSDRYKALLAQEHASARERRLLQEAMTALRLGENEAVVSVKLEETLGVGAWGIS